jgi:hypothetical protein
VARSSSHRLAVAESSLDGRSEFADAILWNDSQASKAIRIRPNVVERSPHLMLWAFQHLCRFANQL